MDTRNVIAAISLSAAVIILYGLFFAPPTPDPDNMSRYSPGKPGAHQTRAAADRRFPRQSGNQTPANDRDNAR